MSILKDVSLRPTTGPTVLSRRPIVRLRAAPLSLQARSTVVAGWTKAIEALARGFTDTEIDTALILPLQTRTPTDENSHLQVGSLVARIATSLMQKASAATGEFNAVASDSAYVLAFWNDWMEGVGIIAGRHAVQLCELSFAAPEKLQEAIRADLAHVFAARVDSFIGPMVHAAEARDIPWRSLRRGYPVLSYGQGARQQLFHGTMSNLQSRACVHLTTRKHLSVGLLRAAGLPVPENELVNSRNEARAAARRLGFPIVVKPNAGSRAANVTLNLMSEEEVVKAFEACERLGMRTLVERQYPGLPYRVTVCDGKAFGALFHAIPFVTGDGETSLRDLIARTNEKRRMVVDDDHILPTPLRTEEFVEEMEWRLREQGITLDDVPAFGRRILLTITPALGRGGIQVDVTNQMHPDTLELAEEAARVLQSRHLGVDFLITDITKPHDEAPLVINEVNAAPGVRSHIFVQGPARDLPESLFSPFFSSGDEGRIPIAAVIGGEAGDCLNLLTRLLSSAGETAGFANSNHAHVNGFDLRPAEGAAAHPGRALLRDRRPSVAVMAFDFDDIILRGLPSDRFDVVAIPRDLLRSGLQPVQQQALETLVGLPGDMLVLPHDTAADNLCLAAPHRRLILVADKVDDTTSPAPKTNLVAAEKAEGEVRLVAYQGGNKNPLGRIPVSVYDGQIHAWAAAILLGLKRDALLISRLISKQSRKPPLDLVEHR